MRAVPRARASTRRRAAGVPASRRRPPARRRHRARVDADAFVLRRRRQDRRAARRHPPRAERRRRRRWASRRGLIRELRAGPHRRGGPRGDAGRRASEHGCELPDDVIVAARRRRRAAGHESGYGAIAARRAGRRRHLAARPALALLGRHDAHVRGGRGEPPAELAAYWAAHARVAASASIADGRGRAPTAARLRARRASRLEARPADRSDQGAGRRCSTEGYFHGLGHGVGLEVHERPDLGRAGARLDRRRRHHARARLLPAGLRRLSGSRTSCVVTDDGCEILTDFPYEL